MRNLGCALMIGAVAAYYAITGYHEPRRFEEKYHLPQEIAVIETNQPYENRESTVQTANSDEVGLNKKLEKIVKIKDIDFSKEVIIKTDRYRYVKSSDWLPSRVVGHVCSIPGKIFFWDWNYGWGQDEDRSKSALAMLEEHKDIKDLTLRLNHNEGFYDMYRMFTEKKLRDRNNIFARVLIGVPLSIGDEIWAEFSRGSYYNPLTQTVVCYSNIESITAHELGHHKDFQKFDRDWIYMLTRAIPPVTLYQEWKASSNACDIRSKEDSWQFNRYL